MCGPVDEPNHDAYNEPFREISQALLQREFGTDIQVYVIVHHERALGEHTDQRAEASALRNTGAALIQHRVKHRQSENRNEQRSHSCRHRGFDSFLRTVYGGIFQELVFQLWQNGEAEAPENEIGDEPAQSRQRNTRKVHTPPSMPSVIYHSKDCLGQSARSDFTRLLGAFRA
jgi:hypothetical protein